MGSLSPGDIKAEPHGTSAIVSFVMNPVFGSRPNARIVRSAQDEIKTIQTLLSDVYRDAGDGRTLLRELVQNADDAEARRLTFAVVKRGLCNARNPLLRGPALIVANDGPFLDLNWNALHQALGDSKSADTAKIGRFGVGLKSVFHICEAFVYLGAEPGRDTLRSGALNPWAGTGNHSDSDPLHPEWDTLDRDDSQYLLDAARALIGPFTAGLLLWIPLRLREQLDRAEDGQPYGLGQNPVEPASIVAWFERPESLALLLAQCGHLRSVEAGHCATVGDWANRTTLVCVDRPRFERCSWVGRYHDDDRPRARTFEGKIKAYGEEWSVSGVDAVGHDDLRRLRFESNWPSDRVFLERRSALVRRKALAHAAITVLYRRSAVPGEVRLRWAVFLPLDDAPAPSSGPVVETVQRRADADVWDIIMHGYFWPSHDRRSIPGVTDGDDDGNGELGVRARWNRGIRDELMLPLLPAALEHAVRDVPQDAAWGLLDAVASTKTVQRNISFVTKKQSLLPVVTESGVRWKVDDAGRAQVLAIPSWKDAPKSVREAFVTRTDGAHGVIFIDAHAPRIGGTPATWAACWIEVLLSCVSVDLLRIPKGLSWVAQFVRYVLGPQQERDDDAGSTVVADWLAERVANGALTGTADGLPETRIVMRTSWLRVYEALPQEWLIYAPIESRRAVEELASAGVVGAGLLPIPLGKPSEPVDTSHPDPDRLDHALRELGTQLANREAPSQSARDSRLVLAETLLSARDDRPLDDEFTRLRLLRALQLPEGRDDAWSVSELRQRTAQHRVFARTAEEPARAPRQDVTELAKAVGNSFWLVPGAVPSTTEVPLVTNQALADAVIHAAAIAHEPELRVPLLERLAEADADAVVGRALRVLLTGLPAGGREECDLYYVRSGDTEKGTNRRTLEILLQLRRQAWRAVEPSLAEPLRHALFDRLRIKAVDPGVLQLLLQEVLDTAGVEWSRLKPEEVLHLLRHLYGMAADHKRWCAMPLHRGIDHHRGVLDNRALRASGRGRLPPGLEAEIRLLQPDTEVADLYGGVPPLDVEGILRRMLENERPHQFVGQIIEALRSDSEGDQIILPRDPTLRALLMDQDWLPCCSSGASVAPALLLDLPGELQSLVAPLTRALGELRLPIQVAPDLWSVAKGAVHEILGRPTPAKQVERLASGLDTSAVANIDVGSFLILHHADDVDKGLIKDAVQSPLVVSHCGWMLVHAAATVLGIRRGEVHGAVLRLACALCAPVPARQQVSMLNKLAETRPRGDSPSGGMFRRLVQSFAKVDGFFENVLPLIKLPTQDGHWHPAAQVARSPLGVEQRHRLVADLRAALRLDPRESVGMDNTGERLITPGRSSDSVLAPYFEPWANRLEHSAVGAFLILLGNGNDNATLQLAEHWLGTDISVAHVRRELAGADEVRCANVGVFVSGSVGGTQVEAVNILGRRVTMKIDPKNDTIFASAPELDRADFWKIDLRDVEPSRRAGHELTELLGNTGELWAVQFLGLDRRRVRDWWARWGTGSQAQVLPVRASILANLPLTLRRLDVHERGALRDTLRNAERAQRKREQARGPELQDAADTERKELERLASLIEEPEYNAFLRDRVRERIERSGYGADSVLLELVQNADDALAQAAEIAGGRLPTAARRVVVRVHEVDSRPTMDLKHFGRPINDSGGAKFSGREDRQWDQDLYFMMLMDLSGKPGEIPGQATVASTTGRFGLGFKSVHLISDAPSVVSGSLAFSIEGGLLPKEEHRPDDRDLLPVDDHQATRIRLPLRSDGAVDDLIARIFRRFHYTRGLLPAFAREVREIVVDGGPCAGVSVFNGEPVANAPGWSVARTTTELPGRGEWRILRFRPGVAETGTAALVLGLRDGLPTPFPSDLPFLWNVTPTSEGWGCGYAVNGPFKLDPGRTHVSLDHQDTLRVADQFGEALGQGIEALGEALDAGVGPACGLPGKEGVATFTAALWMVLSSGIASEDTLRRTFLRRLHGPGKGISAWMSAGSVVPSGLPAPFRERLPPFKPGMRIEIAMQGLDNSALCSAIAGINDLARLACGHLVVASTVAQRLSPLLRTPIVRLEPSDIFGELAKNWGYRLTPERLHALRPLAPESVWKLIDNDYNTHQWITNLVARSVAGEFVPLRELLLPREPDLSDPRLADRLDADEPRRAAFAPDTHILDPAYIASPEDIALFQRLRTRLRIDSATMAGWFTDLADRRRPAALRYLLRGSLQPEVLQGLVPSATRPSWLNDGNSVRRMVDDLNEEHWRCQSLLSALFSEPIPPSEGRPSANFLIRLRDWWDNEDSRRRVIRGYEQKAWPQWLIRDSKIKTGLRDSSQDHWLALLVLGACRGLGRLKEEQHRGFLELAHREGWWGVFKEPDKPGEWMRVLRTWQDRAVDHIEYSRWMSLFPVIYQLSRYLETYRQLLLTADRRQSLNDVIWLLAPRTDPSLTGAGRNFDAPPAPLNMGLHWILRELVRLRVLDGAEFLLPHCWVPSEQVFQFLGPFGLERPDSSASNSDKARMVFGFLADKLNTTTPHLHYSFDIPLRHVDATENLQRQFGSDG